MCTHLWGHAGRGAACQRARARGARPASPLTFRVVVASSAASAVRSLGSSEAAPRYMSSSPTRCSGQAGAEGWAGGRHRAAGPGAARHTRACARRVRSADLHARAPRGAARTFCLLMRSSMSARKVNQASCCAGAGGARAHEGAPGGLRSGAGQESVQSTRQQRQRRAAACLSVAASARAPTTGVLVGFLSLPAGALGSGLAAAAFFRLPPFLPPRARRASSAALAASSICACAGHGAQSSCAQRRWRATLPCPVRHAAPAGAPCRSW